VRTFRDQANSEIKLSESVFFGHILEDHSEHYILISNTLGGNVDFEAFYLDGITKVPSNPIETRTRDNRVRYYGWIRSVNKYMVVAVKFLPDEAWVSTAFLSSRMR
jgi:hypothetical protein